MGGSEGPSDEEPGVSAPAGVVHDITMPKLGETVTEGTIGSWLKQAGDTIEMDDPLFEVSTDKVDSEIPSPYDGVLLEILVAAGETVPVGTPLARIGEAGAALPTGRPTPAAPAPRPRRPPATAARGPADGAPVGRRRRRDALAAGPPAGRGERPGRRAPSPGTGVGGRIRREDVEKALAGGGAEGRRRAARAPHRRPPQPAPAAGRRRRPQPQPRAGPPASATRATRSSRCPGCGWRWPAG